MFRRDRYIDEIEKLTATWSDEYRRNSAAVIEKIGLLLDIGASVEEAVDVALSQSEFFQRNREALDDVLIRSAAAGFGILPITISTTAKAAIIGKINTLPWAPDKMPLSVRLHGTEGTIKALIAEQIRAAKTSGTNWIDLARNLYQGYEQGGILKPAALPEYLNELQKAARNVSYADPKTVKEFARLLRRAKTQVDGLAADGAPNRSLKIIYSNLVRVAETGTKEAMDQAIAHALDERARYFAERISRTEIARAWADGYYAQTYDDQDIVAYRWRLSSRHPQIDICDFHANANLYGLGPGVYLKKQVPQQPAHPHCICHWEEVFVGQVDPNIAAFDLGAGREWLKQQPAANLENILGKKGVEEFNNGGDWRLYMRNWEGHADPNPRLARKDFAR